MPNNLRGNKIDVVIPVYNGEKFVLDAIASAVNQTLPPATIIVVDDGSTDTTHAIVSSYAETSKIPIQLVRKENGGLSSARNAGIKASTADFIAFLDADDVWVKNKLEEQLRVYETTTSKNLALVYCDYDVIDTNGSIQYANYKAPLDTKRMRGMVFATLLERNKITGSGSGVVIKRNVFDAVGLFDETLRFGEDWDMWLRIAETYEVDFADHTLVHIRKHAHNMTANPANIFERELGFYNKWISRISGNIPLFWADKITFRIISQFPKKNLLPILRTTIAKENYKKLFRTTFGSFYLYIPVFFVRQFFNVFFAPHYFKILLRFIQHKGK